MILKQTAVEQVSFVEQKLPDWDRLRLLHRMSAAQNHWANHGPVCRLLEDRLAEIAGLGEDDVAVACCSGTAALNILAGIHGMKLGRPLRWAVSAFGFFSTMIGPFSESMLVDCDEQGMLDLELLSQAPEDTYDGVCVTNIFGLHPDLSRYITFCQERGKPLILDNAYGFGHFNRSQPDAPAEILSLHHTKPWGFGEGGCAIISREDEAAARSLINFGVGMEEQAGPYAFNGKLSDVSAAFLVDRLEQKDEWMALYRQQQTRLTDLIAGAQLAVKPIRKGDPGINQFAQAIFVADQPVSEAQLENPHFVIRKYYRPVRSHWPRGAQELYDRIINLPCHPQMAQLSDETIVQTLREALGR